MTYELHPLCTLFPRMNEADFEALKRDIKENGLTHPIVIHEGMILDGGNRNRACVDLGIEPETVLFSGKSIVSFVISSNLHRRHLSPGQQAAIVASAQDWGKAQPNGGDRRSDQSATLHSDTAADRAAQSGASLRTQKAADAVAKADPELVKQVAHGEITLPQAVKQVAAKKASIQLIREVTPDATTAELMERDKSTVHRYARMLLESIGERTEFNPDELRVILALQDKLSNLI